MATGMNPAYDFLYQPSSSSIHQPLVPGADPSLATEIMPAPPPLSGFPRVNEKGQMLTRTGKVSHKKRPPGFGTIVALSNVSRGQQPAAPTTSPVAPAPDLASPNEDAPEAPAAFAESSGARKRMRLSRQPSVPTSLGTRASTRQLRNSPLTTDGNSMTPEGVASSQHPTAAPMTDRESSVTALASPGTSLQLHSQTKRPRGKKSHASAPPDGSPLTPRSASLTTRDARPGPESVVHVKPEPTDDPFISHIDPPPEMFDHLAHVGTIEDVHMSTDLVHPGKGVLGTRRKGKGKDNIAEFGGDHEADGYNNIKPPPLKFKLETSTKRVNIHGLFDELMYNLACEPPKVFTLPEDVRSHFKDVTASASGAYMESGDVVRERLSRHGFVEERDPYRLRDRHGAMVLCCKCGLSASSSTMEDEAHVAGDFSGRGHPIISCDYCRLHWHMDCLEPPMAVVPVNGRKWMCPNHASHSIPKIRIPKSGSRVVTVTKPGQRNNGNIEVIMDSEPVQLIPQVMRAAYEEVRINGQRYRVPEQTIVLDFWKKAKRNRMREVSRVSSPAPPHVIQHTTPARSSPGILTPSSSPLTSLSSLSDVEDQSLENDQPDGNHDMGDLAAAELLHAFHIQARSVSSPNSLLDDTLHTERSLNTRDSSPLSSILSDDDPHDYNETVSSIFKGEAVSNSLSPGPPISQPIRSPANGIKIIPKAGSFAIRIPASKAAARAVVRESSQPRRPIHPQLSSPRPDGAPSSTTGAKETASKRKGGETKRKAPTSNPGPTQDNDLSPAEIAKLKKIKALILAKGEDELLKFLRS